MMNFDEFGGFTNNQIKTIIFMLRTVTEDLDYPLEVLLPKVFHYKGFIWYFIQRNQTIHAGWKDFL